MKTSQFVFSPRIIRSMRSDCWGEDFMSHAELESAVKVYSDEFLRELAGDGLNGIWVHVVLRETVASHLFPRPDPRQLLLLNRLVQKAARYGIKVYAYLCEPRALMADDPFWKKHPEAKGRPMLGFESDDEYSGIFYGLCTSTPAVREFIEESCHNLFRLTPGLGGAFCITASEFRTHCYRGFGYKERKQQLLENLVRSDIWRLGAMYKEPDKVVHKLREVVNELMICPRCMQREPVEVVAELIALMNKGVKSAAPGAGFIAWSWAWSNLEPDPQKKLIELLPKDVILLSDWETGSEEKTNLILGRKYKVDEYSLSYIGPCPRFVRQLNVAKKRKMRVMAKLQVATTHELATVPYIPVPFNLAEKMVRMRKYGVDGFLGCWNFGGDNTPMSKVAGEMSRSPMPSIPSAIRRVAAGEYGETSASAVVAAWEHFSRAWREYPFSCPMTWLGPLNYAVAFQFPMELYEKMPPPTYSGFKAGGISRYPKGHLASTCSYLDHWIKPFGPKTTDAAFSKLLALWIPGIQLLQQAWAHDNRNMKLKLELNLARHIALSVRSTIHIIRFYTLFAQSRSIRTPTKKRTLVRKMKAILREEIKTAVEEKELYACDPRLGYHPEGHINLFTRKDLDYKIAFILANIKRLG